MLSAAVMSAGGNASMAFLTVGVRTIAQLERGCHEPMIERHNSGLHSWSVYAPTGSNPPETPYFAK